MQVAKIGPDEGQGHGIVVDQAAAAALRAAQDACNVLNKNRRIDPRKVDMSKLAGALAVHGD